MKKILLMLLAITLLTACGHKDKSKSLRCEKTSTISENIVNEVISATFDNDQIKTSDIKIETLITEKYLAYTNVLEEDLKNMYQDYYDKTGITINMITDTNTIAVKISIDFDLLDDNAKQILGINGISTYEETKNVFVSNGYICK